jgi:ABC-type multidrug transport system ATPase subunit
MVPPRRGAVFYRGAPPRLGDEGFRRKIGWAGHDPGLYGRLSVRENLALFGALYGVPASRVEEVMASLELGDRSEVRVAALSAGWKRRVAVGRALLHEPELLLLDEPYANLDDEASDLVSAAIRAWWRPGRVALIATHGAKRVKAFAHGSLILKQGQAISHRVRPATDSTPSVDGSWDDDLP